MKTITCICNYCGIPYEKQKGEYNRKIRKGTPFYCSYSCGGKVVTEKRDSNNKSEETITRLRKLHSVNLSKIELSEFRALLGRAKGSAKKRGIDFTITIEDLVCLWQEQKGKCNYLNVDLILPLRTNDYLKDKSPIYSASLDRIDSGLGYIPGNIQFVSRLLNFAKNSYDSAVVWELIRIIKEA